MKSDLKMNKYQYHSRNCCLNELSLRTIQPILTTSGTNIEQIKRMLFANDGLKSNQEPNA